MPTPQLKRNYVGFTTNQGDGITVLYDSSLIQQDLMNIFQMKKGDNIVDPSMGSIIWSMLFDPATEATVNVMRTDTIKIFQSDKRVTLQSLDIVASTDPTIPGYTMTALVLYAGQKVAQTFSVTFMSSLRDNGV